MHKGYGGDARVLDLDQLLRQAVEQDASDVHIKVGSPPFVRIDGRLEKTGFDAVSPAETERVAFAIMPKQRAEEFLGSGEADFAYSVAGLGRFRVNVMRQRGSVGLVLRKVQQSIPSFEDLGLPPAVRRLSENPRGLVLVTGPTGSGKTTTLACMIDHINDTMSRHIVTIEDPIEVLHADKQSIVNQREIGTDTADFASALKRVLRQDPDVILVGEMRDTETVKTALSAAETGHLVFSTLHTISATETINRVIDFFPPFEQRQVRMSLAGSLRGIVSQRLVECRAGTGRVPAVEVLVATGRVFDKIVNSDETHEIEEIIAEGEYYGMQTFDQSLLSLYKRGAIDLREALAASSRPHDLRLMIEQFTMAQANEAAEPA
ncbi:MAG: Tfp pilus assembly protein pilus retraction ATPase PilT [Actinomycetia bacterium]|nr:Tfp pilus assembly protein pilus retraction ATPase PilT [Actinomycetes bacterium]